MYVKSALVGIALALGVFALPTPSQATEYDVGTSCMKQGELISFLNDAYQESLFADGRLENGGQVEVYMSDAGSWTMIEFVDGGYGCIHSSSIGKDAKRHGNYERPPS